MFKEGDLIDYWRQPTTKDEHGGWNGPYPVISNDPERGQLSVSPKGHTVRIRYAEARHTLFTKVLMTSALGMDNDAMDSLLEHMEKLTPGRRPEIFGVLPEGKPPRWTLTKDSKNAPKIYMALKFTIKS